jgi:hypothetical protein
LTQDFSDFPKGKNRKKASEAGTNLKPGPFVVVEPCYFIDRHLRFQCQELDGTLLMGSSAVISVHTNSHPCVVSGLYAQKTKVEGSRGRRSSQNGPGLANATWPIVRASTLDLEYPRPVCKLLIPRLAPRNGHRALRPLMTLNSTTTTAITRRA